MGRPKFGLLAVGLLGFSCCVILGFREGDGMRMTWFFSLALNLSSMVDLGVRIVEKEDGNS